MIFDNIFRRTSCPSKGNLSICLCAPVIPETPVGDDLLLVLLLIITTTTQHRAHPHVLTACALCGHVRCWMASVASVGTLSPIGVTQQQQQQRLSLKADMGVPPPPNTHYFHAFLFLVSQSRLGSTAAVMFARSTPLWGEVCAASTHGEHFSVRADRRLAEFFGAGMVSRSAPRPAPACGKEEVHTAAALSVLYTFHWLLMEERENHGETMSNHKGGGMDSKERLYELWMLYNTKVSAEDLPLTPVVAAAPRSEVSNTILCARDRRHSRVSVCLSLIVCSRWYSKDVACLPSSCVFTQRWRLPCAHHRRIACPIMCHWAISPVEN